MAATHIPVAEAARELPELLARVRAGEDIVIDDGVMTPVRLEPVSSSPHGTAISDVIARLKYIEEAHGGPLVMDDDYAADMLEIVANRRPRDTSAWD